MIVTDLNLPISYTRDELENAIRKKLRRRELKIHNIEILKRSIDARKKPDLRYCLSVRVNEPATAFRWPEKPEFCGNKRAVVVGAGPAGLFASLALLERGVPVLLLEQGEPVEEREKTVSRFFETGELNVRSNVQFGEGGAGTFSDGKLNTQTHTPLNDRVLRTFEALGAGEEILYDQKPHIGTDKLLSVIRAFREKLTELGAEIHFGAKMTDILTENGRVTGIVVNGEETVRCDALCLAVGHSARDTFVLLKNKGIPMEQKPFAMGVRIEHPERMITEEQYGTLDYESLGAAPYKLTYKTSEGRGVYTFCMCPGGYVVNASSEPEKLCINGMSYAARDGKNSNSALVVQVFPSDFPSEDVLSGVELQRSMEEKAYKAGKGRIPVQTYGDFIGSEKTGELGAFLPEMKGKYQLADLNEVLPPFIVKALKEAIPVFGKRIKGFDRKDAILSAVEARTSSPVRILRDESGESSLKGVFPMGEGAGYSGGILSSAKDGLETGFKAAEKILKDQ